MLYRLEHVQDLNRDIVELMTPEKGAAVPEFIRMRLRKRRAKQAERREVGVQTAADDAEALALRQLLAEKESLLNEFRMRYQRVHEQDVKCFVQLR